MNAAHNLTTIGWREHIDLEEWGISKLRVKVDTGARTSSIHVRNIEELEDDFIKFEVVIKEKPVRKTVVVTAKTIRKSIVKSSNGIKQNRYVCKTKFKLGEVEKDIDISLVCRAGMLCRMLLGRKALEDSFVVDSSKRYLIKK